MGWIARRGKARGRGDKRRAVVGCEGLEGRVVLSHLSAAGWAAEVAARAAATGVSASVTTTPTASLSTQKIGPGFALKVPQFNSFYKGPHVSELNVAAASARLYPNGGINFVGRLAGTLRSNKPLAFVFGVNRGGAPAKGPFPGNPNVRFDALVSVNFNPPLKPPTAKVTDLKTGKSTILPQNAVTFHPDTFMIAVPLRLLPSRGLPPSRYTVAFWAKTSLAGPTSSVASLLPVNAMFPLGIS